MLSWTPRVPRQSSRQAPWPAPDGAPVSPALLETPGPAHGWVRAQPLPGMPGPTAGGEEVLRESWAPLLSALLGALTSQQGVPNGEAFLVSESSPVRSSGQPGGSQPVAGLLEGRPCQQGCWLAGSRPARVGEHVSGPRRGLPDPSLAEPPAAPPSTTCSPLCSLHFLPVMSLLLTPDCLGLPEPDRSSLVPCCPHRRWGAFGGHCPQDQNDASTGQASPTLVPHPPPRTISGYS